MKALAFAAAAVGAALVLAGCHSKKSEPVPGPQSQTATIPVVGPVAQRLVQGTHQRGAFAWKRAKWTG